MGKASEPCTPTRTTTVEKGAGGDDKSLPAASNGMSNINGSLTIHMLLKQAAINNLTPIQHQYEHLTLFTCISQLILPIVHFGPCMFQSYFTHRLVLIHSLYTRCPLCDVCALMYICMCECTYVHMSVCTKYIM